MKGTIALFDAMRINLGRAGIGEPTKDEDGTLAADSYRTLDVLDALRGVFPHCIPVTSEETRVRMERDALVERRP